MIMLEDMEMASVVYDLVKETLKARGFYHSVMQWAYSSRRKTANYLPVVRQ